jgi:hypothetical protein
MSYYCLETVLVSLYLCLLKKERKFMAIPNGLWKINANGFSGTLLIGGADTQGNLSESSVFDNAISGFWDETSQKLTFIRVLSSDNPLTSQIYTGYLIPPPSGQHTRALAGSFEAFRDAGGTAQRTLFGWFATQELIP